MIDGIPTVEDITPEIAATTLWHYGVRNPDGPGYEPGDWRKLLLGLIAKSDPVNRAKLATIYPGEVLACDYAELLGSDILSEIARSAQRSASFTCPTCQATSHNPNDFINGYCGRCHKFTGKDTSRETTGSGT